MTPEPSLRTVTKEPQDHPLPSVASLPQEEPAPSIAQDYRETISRLSAATHKGQMVAALVDFAQAIRRPEMADGDRLAGLLRKYRGVEILRAISTAPIELAGNPLSYVQEMLEGKRVRAGPARTRGAMDEEAIEACRRA